MHHHLHLWASIPRTRASITRYSLGRPVYEETDPYRSKLPAEFFVNRTLIDFTLEDALSFALAADKPDRALDTLIWYKALFDPAVDAGRWEHLVGNGHPHYSGSLDDAVRLYEVKPPMISTDPLDVVCDALRLMLLNR